ncbi:TetR family transcriptional regulator [Aliivibrio fischeri]|uniref:TetR/AcrR family transcriptional regulator n=1 Tax=Aliivibrio fischeri TaxID=668 RepID=UPI0012D9CC9E|nr:TetR/AcrR family transcriptional regulator [Aliivibrio fischeri]MUJ19684.1 TetR family transcriptional regulator [Aliivibrio fischeri]MUK31896.1 TetR family transcriptional regulator [Aliivibrio fischeri]MUL02575.1 TetR family transcriptional regulator [Aliivibrio fischeri]
MTTKNSKGRPALISKKEIIECALTLGLSKASMNGLGKALGVTAPALYRHMKSKNELIVECCDYIMGKVELPKQSDWESYLYDFGENFRQVLLATPGSVEFIRYNQQFTPNSKILVDNALGVLMNAKFDVQTGFMAFSSIFTRVTDIVQHQEQSQYLLSNGVKPDLQLPDAETLPNLALLFGEVKPVNYDNYFKDGMKITLEGIKAVYC